MSFPFGHATSSKSPIIAPPKAHPIHFAAMGATISPINSVLELACGRTIPYCTP